MSNHIIAQLHASLKIFDFPLQGMCFSLFVTVLLTKFRHPLLRVGQLLLNIPFADVRLGAP